jgi:hypothetical protein
MAQCSGEDFTEGTMATVMVNILFKQQRSLAQLISQQQN